MSVEFKKTGVVQCTPIEDAKTLIINKNALDIKPNLILDSAKVTGGGCADGITREFLADGTLKIVSTSGNGNWCSLSFARDSNTSIGAGLAIGDKYTISLDIKIESGSVLPTLFINSGNGYKQLLGDTTATGIWQRVYYSSTWANPGTGYGNISLHLGFSSAIGTYYVKNFKLEKSSVPTIWLPNSTDATYSTYGYSSLNTTIDNVVKTTEIIEN